jgi:hypothetical protein
MVMVGGSWRYLRLRHCRRAVLGVALLLSVPGVLTLGTPSAADAATPSADLAVTSPPDPIPAAPGTTVTTTLTVGNLGQTPLDVTIATRSVNPLNNGKTRFGAGPDPRFSGRVKITPDALSLPARSEQTVQIAVDMPAGLPPDDYFLGFLVSPVINSSSVAVENDVGGLVVLDIPGPRDRRLAAGFDGPSWLSLSLSGSAAGVVRATSVGKSAVAFTTTVATSGHPSPAPPYLEAKSQLLPSGLSRDIPIRVSSWLGLGWYTFHATLVYDRTDQATAEVTVSRTVLIVNPLWFLVIPALLVLWVWRRRRKRRGRKTGLHSAKHSSSSAKRRSPPVPVG